LTIWHFLEKVIVYIIYTWVYLHLANTHTGHLSDVLFDFSMFLGRQNGKKM